VTVRFSPPEIETPRLLLRPFERPDEHPLVELHAEASFWWYPFRRGWTAAETMRFLDRVCDGYATGLGVAAVMDRQSGQLAGWAGLSTPDFLPEVMPAVEIGWRLGERFRGRGYATEAGKAWLHHGFEQLRLDAIVSIFEPENLASGRVMDRLGLAPHRVTVHPTLGVPLHVRRIDRPTWEAGGR
jgi:RimJ/RimL family protein N-acetyltransferase